MNQKGFATLEVIMMVVVIGILATIAVPRFTDVTTKANTAKIQADLSTIDTAVQMYYMEKGSDASSIDDLVNGNYLMDKPTPPTGEVYIEGSKQSVPATEYTIGSKTVGTGTSAKSTTRAMLGEKVAGDFYAPKS